MIRWTKEGKIDRSATFGVIASGALSPSQADKLADVQDDLADALDVAVAALRKIRGDKPTKRDEKDEEIADDALHQIGVDQ